MLKLKELRGNKSQQQISKYLDLPQTTYSNYEKGKRQADYITLIKLADYFNVTLDYLLGRDFNPVTSQEPKSKEITDKEKELLNLFNACSLGLQNRILGYIESGLEKERNIVAKTEQSNKRA